MSALSDVSLYDAEQDETALHAAIRSGQVPVAVVGLGKMGLPLASVFATVTGNTVGVDVDQEHVDAINSGRCPVAGEPGLAHLVERTVETGSLTATTDGVAAASRARVHVLIVPTTVDGHEGADLSAMRAAARNVGRGLDPGDLVVVESTVPPRTCVDVLEPLLVAESGLDADQFGLAFCPERTSSGRALRDIGGTYPKVVGGVDEESTRAAATLYDRVTDNDVLTVAATTAECVKVFEGVYRDVNIALANELATFAEDIGTSVTDAIEVANTLPMCDIHDPGAGVGGHCIPYYPYFLLSEFETDGDLLRTARAVNDRMPEHVADRLRTRFERRGESIDGATVALLGVTYRAGVAETRKSPSIPLARSLTASGADVVGVDPLLSDDESLPFGLVELSALGRLDLDAAVLVTDHDVFDTIDWDALPPMVVVDTRDVLDLDGTAHDHLTIGSP